MIRIYTVKECDICKETKEYLNSKKVEYEEIDMSVGGIKKNVEIKKRFKEMGLKTYPIIIIQPKDDDEMIFPKFDKDSLDDILEEIK